MSKTIVKGDELMLFKDGKSLAYATSHSVSITGSEISISSKDHGYWGASEIGDITWEITSENLYVDSEYDSLFNAMIAKSPITVTFGHANAYNANGLGSLDNWTPDTSVGAKYYQGPAIITSLQTNANTGENATYSITLKGNGALEQKTVASE